MDTPRPTKRAKYVSASTFLTSSRHDFSSTFDVLVSQLPGDVKRFTIHTDIFTKRSKFFAAACRSEWVAGGSSKPVDLSDEDPDVFHAYLNCVYVGPDTVEEMPGAFEREVCYSMGGSSDLYIYNICKDVTREMLIGEFKGFGEIKRASIFNSNCLVASTFESSLTARIPFTTSEAGGAAMKASDGRTLSEHRVSARPCRSYSEERAMQEYELADSHYSTLINLCLLADKVQDFSTANMVIDKIQQLCNSAIAHPGKQPISIAYQSTVEGSPLRHLLRDMWFYDASPDWSVRFEESGFPHEFLHDNFKSYMRIKSCDNDIDRFLNVANNDDLVDEPECDIPVACRYHQHDDEHPFCVKSLKEEKPCKTCKSKGKAFTNTFSLHFVGASVRLDRLLPKQPPVLCF
ncbi:hypothetical protein Q7P35_002775 [Cladosporium inversicolor]